MFDENFVEDSCELIDGTNRARYSGRIRFVSRGSVRQPTPEISLVHDREAHEDEGGANGELAIGTGGRSGLGVRDA